MNPFFIYWAKYEIQEHRLCSNGKKVLRCTYDGRTIHGRERRFPCTACYKNKRDFRWADYKAKDIINKEKQKIADARISVLQEETNKADRVFEKVSKFHDAVSHLAETHLALLAFYKTVEEVNSSYRKRTDEKP